MMVVEQNKTVVVGQAPREHLPACTRKAHGQVFAHFRDSIRGAIETKQTEQDYKRELPVARRRTLSLEI